MGRPLLLTLAMCVLLTGCVYTVWVWRRALDSGGLGATTTQGSARLLAGSDARGTSHSGAANVSTLLAPKRHNGTSWYRRRD